MTVSTYDPTHVLLAEDDDEDYLVFSLALQELSFRVILTRAENGEILLKMLDEQHPDILFLDLLMPCKDGRQCLKEIRANRKYDTLPIVVYSSFHDLKNIEFCYREGANLYVFKPTDEATLVSILRRILSIDWKKTLYFPSPPACPHPNPLGGSRRFPSLLPEGEGAGGRSAFGSGSGIPFEPARLRRVRPRTRELDAGKNARTTRRGRTRGPVPYEEARLARGLRLEQ